MIGSVNNAISFVPEVVTSQREVKNAKASQEHQDEVNSKPVDKESAKSTQPSPAHPEEVGSLVNVEA